jgi:hypothetical protein
MLKFFTFLQKKSRKVEVALSQIFERRMHEPFVTKLFFFKLIGLNLKLIFLELIADAVKFFIILLADPGTGFNLFFRQRDLADCPHSYHHYHKIRRKIRLFSFSGLSALALGLMISTLVVNLLFNGKLTGFAATFNWVQSDWTGGASTTAIAMDPGNRTGWTRYLSKDPNVSVGAGGISMIASTVVAYTVDSSADFEAGGVQSNLFIDEGSVKLTKPLGASCTEDRECFGGSLLGWCNPLSNLCETPWMSDGSCPGFLVLVEAKATTSFAWKDTQTACDTPQCGLDGAQSGDSLVADNGVDFSSYPARNFCKQLGARLPTFAEARCVLKYPAIFGSGYSQLASSIEEDMTSFQYAANNDSPQISYKNTAPPPKGG